jgi:type I restriction enzyme S subunit
MERATLKDICEVSWGDTNVTKASYVSTGYPAFSASGCDGFLPYFNHDGPGIVLSAIGAQCGKTWFTTDKWSCIKNTIYVKATSRQADIRFVFYALSDPEVWPKRGAAQPFISQTDARNVEIPLPPLAIQRHIAGILSAYDELIENSQRRIKILESMARALYREWFVHFRFPGHESVSRVPSPLGEIPKGWEVTTLGRLVEIKKGKNITRDTIRDGTVPVVAGGIAPAYFHDVPNTQSPVITISASGANAGFVNLYYVDVWASDCSYIDVAATPHVFHFYLWLDYRRAAVTHLQRGSAQPHVYPKDLASLDALRVPEDCLIAFSSQIEPIFALMMRLTAKVENLRRTRDLLLPRLLSGQIEVEPIAA